MTLLGSDVRKVFETILPDKPLLAIAQRAKLQERVRKLDVVRLLRSMVIAAATGYGGRQADVLRLYLESGTEKVVRGGFYAWFGAELETAMFTILGLAIDFAKSLPRDLPGFLGTHVSDWHIVDSTTVFLDKALASLYPGTGDYAALKIHKRFSVGIGTTVGYHISPAREHDNKHLKIDESWTGLGVLLDLGYASFQLIRDCSVHQVSFVIRLKESWKPKVQRIVRGNVTKTFLAGSDLHALIEDDVLVLDGRLLDIDVSFGSGASTVHCRLVAVTTPEGAYRCYLTNLPRTIGPLQITDLYRVRWEIEGDNKLNKSCTHLDKIGARTGPAVRALVHASMTSSIITCILAHQARLREAPPPRAGTERKTAPIHPQTLALATGSAANSIAAILELKPGAKADKEWDRIAGVLDHLGKDPNWRNKPSVLDQLRGWKISPGKPRKLKAASLP
jgi:hypothetical protein